MATGIVLAAGLSAITGVISYRHGLDVARWTGNLGIVSYLLPLVPDLMIAMSSLVLFIASAAGSAGDRPRNATAVLAGGIGWTVAQNVAAGWQQGWGGRVIDAGVPLAFVLTFDLLLWLFRRFRKSAPAGTVPGESRTLTTLEALQALIDSEHERELAFMLGVDRNRLKGWKRRLESTGDEPGEDAPEGEPETPPVIRYAEMNGASS